MRQLLHLSVRFMPFVGAGIGISTGFVAWLALNWWPPWLAIAMALACEAMLTGAFHEDAVADFCDAFGGGWTKDDVLRILKDSRVGSFGALGLMLAVAMRGGGMFSLSGEWLIASTMASAALGRWCILWVKRFLMPVPDREGLSRDFGYRVGAVDLLFGTTMLLPGIAWMAILDPMRVVIATTTMIVASALFSWYVHRRIGGVTGDCLGCSCYIGQVLSLLIFCAS
jgi:adenosylcobinamide-GDP ribazoletransferase